VRLYLDIDGVLTGDPDNYPGLATIPVVVERGVALLDWNVERIHMLLDQFDEVVWATTWILPPSSLDEVEHMLGVSFEQVPLTWDNYRRSHTTCGKLAAVREHYLANPAPFTWIDDHAGPADYNFVEEQGGRLIVPSYDTGGVYKLMDEDVVFS
jgi:hypothetical protein